MSDSLDQRNAAALGYDLPAGVTNAMIDHHFGRYANPECEKCEGYGEVPCHVCFHRPNPNDQCSACNETRYAECSACEGSGESMSQPTQEDIECDKADRARDAAKDREAEERE